MINSEKKCNQCETKTWQDESLYVFELCSKCFYNSLPRKKSTCGCFGDALTMEAHKIWMERFKKVQICVNGK